MSVQVSAIAQDFVAVGLASVSVAACATPASATALSARFSADAECLSGKSCLAARPISANRPKKLATIPPVMTGFDLLDCPASAAIPAFIVLDAPPRLPQMASVSESLVLCTLTYQKARHFRKDHDRDRAPAGRKSSRTARHFRKDRDRDRASGGRQNASPPLKRLPETPVSVAGKRNFCGRRQRNRKGP
jgi:hypothetical protein